MDKDKMLSQAKSILLNAKETSNFMGVPDMAHWHILALAEHINVSATALETALFENKEFELVGQTSPGQTIWRLKE